MDEERLWDELGYVTWELTVIPIIKRTGALAMMTAAVEGDEGEERGLLVFPSRAEAQAYREDNNLIAGYGIVTLDAPRIAGLLGSFGLRWVALADAGRRGEDFTVTTFDGDRFLRLLEWAIKD